MISNSSLCLPKIFHIIFFYSNQNYYFRFFFVFFPNLFRDKTMQFLTVFSFPEFTNVMQNSCADLSTFCIVRLANRLLRSTCVFCGHGDNSQVVQNAVKPDFVTLLISLVSGRDFFCINLFL